MKLKTICSLITVVCACIYPLNISAHTGKIKANGITITYESFGSEDDETILLISGSGYQLSMWPIDLCNKLVDYGYRVIRFDNRDIGLSQKFDQTGMPDWIGITVAIEEKKTPPLPYTLDDMADDAVELLSVLGIEKAHIVGASMGAMIAQRVAYNNPQHAMSLTSIAGGGGSGAFPMIADIEKMNTIPQQCDPSDTAAFIQREVVLRKILSADYPPDEEILLSEIRKEVSRSYYPDGVIRQSATSMAGFYENREKLLKTINIPTIVIHGSKDPLVIVDAGKEVASLIPNAEFNLIEGMGHDISHPYVINKLVESIIENIKKVNK